MINSNYRIIWVLFKDIITVLYWELHTFMVWVDLNASIMPNYKVARGICGGFMNYAPWKIEIWTFSNHKQRFSKKFIIPYDMRFRININICSDIDKGIRS